jgi:hypothetical protein
VESESAGKNAEKVGKASRKSAKVTDKKSKKPIRKYLKAGLGIALTAAVLCGIWYVPAAVSAAQSVSVSREEALTAAETCFHELVGEEGTKGFYVDYISRRL